MDKQPKARILPHKGIDSISIPLCGKILAASDYLKSSIFQKLYWWYEYVGVLSYKQ